MGWWWTHGKRAADSAKSVGRHMADNDTMVDSGFRRHQNGESAADSLVLHATIWSCVQAIQASQDTQEVSSKRGMALVDALSSTMGRALCL